MFKSEMEFVQPDVFRLGWFCFSRLQTFWEDLICPVCGPYLKTVVCDGISLSFHSKHLEECLDPPTTITSASQRQANLKYFPAQQILKDRKLRRRVRDVVMWRRPTESVSAACPDGASSEEDDDATASAEVASEKVQAKILAHAKSRPEVCDLFKAVDHDSGVLFEEVFGLAALANKTPVPEPYKKLFAQVCAEESVQQMITGPGAEALAKFVQDPTATTATDLIVIPVLYRALEYEYRLRALYDKLLGLCRWLLTRYNDVTAHLLRQHARLVAADETLNSDVTPWHKVSSHMV
ncbi:hypothetical protein HGRIS_007344 [Hohenbuehelia grisea]|uniref:Uncharacterized protein n=1 Tax=Hohenbuehelia grisea TaxID=104357 RepID=A0ABR3J4I0_9AGAR